MDRPLMPKATAVWLVENTGLTFDQIAEFCGLHPLEVKGIADGEVATGVRGLDPVGAGMLTRERDPARRGRPQGAPEAGQVGRQPTSSRPSARSRATRRCPSARTGPTRSPGSLRHHPEMATSRSASCWAPPSRRCRRCATGPTGRARRSGRATRSCWACARRSSSTTRCCAPGWSRARAGRPAPPRRRRCRSRPTRTISASEPAPRAAAVAAARASSARDRAGGGRRPSIWSAMRPPRGSSARCSRGERAPTSTRETRRG